MRLFIFICLLLPQLVFSQEKMSYVIYRAQLLDSSLQKQDIQFPNKRIVYRKGDAIYQRDFIQDIPTANFVKIDGESLTVFTAKQNEKIALTSQTNYPDYEVIERVKKQKQIAGIWADYLSLKSGKDTIHVYESKAHDGFYCPVFPTNHLVLSYQQWFKNIGWLSFEAIEIGEQLMETLPEVNEASFKKTDQVNYQQEQESIIAQLQEKIDRNVASMLGKKAKKFQLTTIDGTRYSSNQLKGKVIVLNFWFVNCGPCRREMPELNQLVQQYDENESVVFLGLALDPPHELPDFLEKNTFLYDIAGDAIYLCDKFKVTNYPSNVIIDKNGNITTYLVGFTPGIGNKLKIAIDDALSD